MATSGEENGDAESLEKSHIEEEIRDEELLERGSNEEEIRDEEVLGGVKMDFANDSNMQEDVSILYHKIEEHDMQIENPNNTRDISSGTNGNDGESSMVVESREPGDLKEASHIMKR